MNGNQWVPGAMKQMQISKTGVHCLAQEHLMKD